MRLYLLLCYVGLAFCFDWEGLNLVDSHLPQVFANQPELKQLCWEDSKCPYKKLIRESEGVCWGFEAECDEGKRWGNKMQTLDCPNKLAKKKYWRQADFGYLQERLGELERNKVCVGGKSTLKCTQHSSMCVATHLYVDLRNVKDRIAGRDQIVLHKGEIGGMCDLNQSLLDQLTSTKRQLTTWGEYLGPYTGLDHDVTSSEHCDVIFDKPVVFVQLDFGGNMYHHFCDFFNLYLTQLANNSWFGTDVQVIRWDHSIRYGEMFEDSWGAFTDYPHKSLYDYEGKRLCFPEATFAFLPRMIFGLFYNTPVEEHCRGSSLFQAFKEHFLHRMGVLDRTGSRLVPPLEVVPQRIRVSFLDRGFNPRYKVYRRVLNQDELIAAMRKIPDFDVQIVKYNREIPFKEQLQITHNSDIFIGMHGAGLTHFLFLPDWAVAFELYNCGDIRCYRDLPRLRGLRYLTWENPDKVEEFNKDEHENYGKHAKFWNYKFDVTEFVRLVMKAKSWLLENDRFAHFRKNHQEL